MRPTTPRRLGGWLRLAEGLGILRTEVDPPFGLDITAGTGTDAGPVYCMADGQEGAFCGQAAAHGGPHARGRLMLWTDKMRVTTLRRLGLALVLLAAVGLAGCGSSGAAHPTATANEPVLVTPSVSPSPSAVPGVAAVQAAVLAYRSMWQAYGRALTVPNPDDPALAKYATDQALQTMTSGLSSAKSQGLRGIGSITNNPKVTKIEPTTAPTDVAISDCLDSSKSHLVRAASGPAYHDTPGGKQLCLADVALQADGTWKVTDFGVRAVGSC